MHSHSGHQMGSHSHGSKPALNLVLVLTAGYMVLQVFGAYVSGSLALFADSGHMAIDVGAVALGIFAQWVARRPPTSEKTFGYYRAEILAALVNGALLFGASVWIIFEAWERFAEPHPVRGAVMTLFAVGGLGVNLIALRLTHSARHASLNIRAIWLHILSDTLGSLAAILAGFAVWKLDWAWADPLISVFLAVLILFGAVSLLLDCVNVLLEGVPKGVESDAIRDWISRQPSVLEVHDFHVWLVRTGVVALTAHLRVRDVSQVSTTLDEVTRYLKTQCGVGHVTLQVEPPTYAHSDSDFDCQKKL